MGSIVAILCRSDSIDDSVTRQMLSSAPHRGPEITVRGCGRCLLGVTNKSDFIDSTISTEGEFMAAFSGNLDNASELTKALDKTDFPPKSTHPADLAVSAFKAFGADAPRRMRGAFACVVTDGRSLWCFRDHLGFQPLFYRDDARAFWVATEPKQIIAGAGLRREPDLEVLEQIFYGRMKEDMPSALQGVSRLSQASVLAVNGTGTSVPQRYWNPAQLLETARMAPEEVGERFATLFGQAISRSLTGEDVISLSGGIDSPAVAAFAAPQHLERTGRPISALSLVFPDLPSVDESSYVTMIAEYLNINLHTHRIRAGVLDDLQRWCHLLDGPVPTVALAEIDEFYARSRELGFRNILTGDLAEFLFCFHRHLIGHLLIHGRWKALMRLISSEIKKGASRKKICWELVLPFIPGRLANWYLHVRGLDAPTRVPDWLSTRKVNEVPYYSDFLQPARRRWSALQLAAFEGCTITMDAAGLCAAVNGVTVRRPFGDVDLWEFFLSLPAEVKFPDLRSKTLARQLLRGRLPNAILDRRDKTVFDDHAMSRIDYATFRQFLVNPSHQFEGVDYRRLAARIEREDFTLVDWLWANDLVRIHAFLSLW